MKQVLVAATLSSSMALSGIAEAGGIAGSIVYEAGHTEYSIMHYNPNEPFESPFSTPPLDSTALWIGNVTPTISPSGATHQMLSLVMNEDIKGSATWNGYPWPLFIQLTSNDNSGDGVGAYVREISAGSSWNAGYHIESFSSSGGTKIGYNAEMHKTGTARTIGLNIQAKNDGTVTNPSPTQDQGINIQSDQGATLNNGILLAAKMNSGISFDPTSSGQQAILVRGAYSVALDAGSAPIRMNAGTPIQLESTGQITLSYDTASQSIVFKNGTTVLAYINISTPATHPLN